MTSGVVDLVSWIRDAALPEQYHFLMRTRLTIFRSVKIQEIARCTNEVVTPNYIQIYDHIMYHKAIYVTQLKAIAVHPVLKYYFVKV